MKQHTFHCSTANRREEEEGVREDRTTSITTEYRNFRPHRPLSTVYKPQHYTLPQHYVHISNILSCSLSSGLEMNTDRVEQLETHTSKKCSGLCNLIKMCPKDGPTRFPPTCTYTLQISYEIGHIKKWNGPSDCKWNPLGKISHRNPVKYCTSIHLPVTSSSLSTH